MQKAWVQSLGWKDPQETEMATHSNILAWEIPWTEEPERLHKIHGASHSQTQLSDSTTTTTTTTTTTRIYVCIHTHTFFFRFFFLIGYYKILSKAPCAI